MLPPVQLSRKVPGYAYTQDTKTWTKGVQQNHCGHLPPLPEALVAPRSYRTQSDKVRSQPVLSPSKLWESWGPAVCHSLLYLLGEQHK